MDALTPMLDQTANDFKSRQVIKRQVNIAKAAITQLQELRVGDNEAFASQFDTISTSVGDNSSTINQLQQSVSDDNTAFASQLDSISTSVGDNSSTINQLEETFTDADEALASQLNVVSASVDNSTAGGLLKFEQVATPLSADSEIALFSKAEFGDTLEQAGLIIASNADANGGGSSVYLVGDKVAIVDSAGNVISLFNADGQILKGRLAVDSVEAVNIAAGTITANEIAINGLTGNVSITASDTDIQATSSSSYIDVAGFTQSITTVANASLLIMFTATLSHVNYGDADVRLLLDNVEFPSPNYRASSAKSGSGAHKSGVSIVGVAHLSAGSHTVRVQLRRASGSGSKAIYSRAITLYQFKR